MRPWHERAKSNSCPIAAETPHLAVLRLEMTSNYSCSLRVPAID
jgi:hypothetical protein